MSDQLVNNIRKENYPLQIYSAFAGRLKNALLIPKLTTFIQEVYRSLEPDHFSGHLTIYLTLDDSLLMDEGSAIKFFDKNILLNIQSEFLVFQIFQDDRLPLLWQNIKPDDVFKSDNAIIYTYQGKKEHFFANQQQIDIINPFDSASIFALQYHYLSEALLRYKEERIRYSSCPIFSKCWVDPQARLYLVQKPEDQMQLSLEKFLHDSLRGVDTVREYNLGASKPVDVRIYWKEANRAALIEMKWLGQSKDASGALATDYANGRANDGLDQVKEYMDLERKDTPTCITKGYLVVIDARRKGLATNPTAIDFPNGLHYQNKEIDFKEEKKLWGKMIGFEKPIRMFAKPICT